MKRIFEVPLEVDLARFSQWLYAQGVDHRIVEEQGVQAIYLRHLALKDDVLMALSRYIEDADVQERLDGWVASHAHSAPALSRTAYAQYIRATPMQAPIIFILIGLSFVVALLSEFGRSGEFIRYLLILDPYTGGVDLRSAAGRWDALLATLANGEYWRVLSPDLIHFNVMHITFNALMLWVLGGQLEIQKGSLSFLALVIFVSIVSNIAQLLETHFLFGGMSGVVYGLVGYCWIWKYYQPAIFLPNALLKFSLIWLILGYTPLTEWLGLGKMANAAHLYGLISGLIWGAITLLVNEKWRKKIPG
jgi:GlpG protein